MLDRGVDNLIGRTPNGYGRNHSTQPRAAGTEEPPLAVHIHSGPDHGSSDLRADIRGCGIRLHDRRPTTTGEFRSAGADRGRHTANAPKCNQCPESHPVTKHDDKSLLVAAKPWHADAFEQKSFQVA